MNINIGKPTVPQQFPNSSPTVPQQFPNSSPTVKRLLKNFKACALALLLTFTATSKAELLFTSNGAAITITGSNPKATGVLIIPATINNLPVTSIGNSAFFGCTGLTRVTLPSSLTSIDEAAFQWCTGLTNVYSTGNAPTVADGVFYNTYQATVYYIAGKTGWGATFAGRPTFLLPAEGFLISINGNAITITGGTPKPTGDLIIPSTINGLPVTSIEANAFYGSYELTSITLPSSLTSIGDAAFYGCSGLTSITIPSGVTFIGSEAFMWCDGLTGVYFLGNAPAKGYGVFGGVLGATVYYVNGKAGWGATFAGRPTAKWVPVEPPVPTVNTLVVQVSPFIQNPSWASVATNTVPQSGAQQFYRMRASIVEVTVDLKNPSWTPVATNNLPSSGSQLFYRLVAR